MELTYGTTARWPNPGSAVHRKWLTSERTRVLVADDHRSMLDSLVRLLSREFDVVSAVTDGVSVVAAAARHAPDVLVLNIAMPGLNGIAAARRVQESGAAVKIVFVTTLYEREFVDGALSVGEVGFVLKDRVAADLIPAIRTVLTGRAYISAPVVR